MSFVQLFHLPSKFLKHLQSRLNLTSKEASVSILILQMDNLGHG